MVLGSKTRTETVPLTGRRRPAGDRLQNAQVSKIMERAWKLETSEDLEADMQAMSIPKDDPRYIRVKGILDRLLASAGLEAFP